MKSDKYSWTCVLSVLLCILLLLPTVLTGCTGGTGEQSSDTEAPSERTDPVTEPDTQKEPVTEPDTEPDTQPESQTEPTADTEPATEPETISVEDYVFGRDLVVTPVSTKAQPVDHITLMGHELTDAVIVTPDEPALRESQAADLLQQMLSAAVGIEVPIVKAGDGQGICEIVIGTTDRDTDTVRSLRAGLTAEGYLLCSDADRLYISGQDARATYNGVQSFLEDYIGCRFFAPESQIVHEAGEIAVPDGLSVAFDPRFIYRCSYYRFVDISDDYQRLYKQHPLVYAGGRVHTMAALAEMKNFKLGQQPCLTDPAVYETVLKNVRATLRANPDKTVISVSQNDTTNGSRGCQCANCRALNEKYGTEGGSLFEFVNRIARDIRDEFPDVKVETLAYNYSSQPPVGMEFEDNVLVMLCTMELCVNHTIDDPDCPANDRYAEYLEAWSKICKTISIWDYHTSFRHYQSPFPIEEMLYDQIVYYGDHNAVSLFSEGNYNSRSGQFEELKAYICSRLMWNPQETKEQYLEDIDDFLKYYYGDGWIYIRRYMDIIRDKGTANGRHNNLWTDFKTAVPFNRKDPDGKFFIDAIFELFRLAEENAGTEEQKAHVRKASIQVYAYAVDLTPKPEWKEIYNELMQEFNIELYNEVTPHTP